MPFDRTRSQKPEAELASELQGTGRFKFHGDNKLECTALERYRDSEALAGYAANLGEPGQAIPATGSVSSELLGEPSAELTAALADSPVRLFTPFLST